MIQSAPIASALLALCLSALLFLPWAGRKHFYTRGEPREALVAQDMAVRGEWILPSGYGGVVPSKPPMTHWLMAIAARGLGKMNEAAARLPSGVAACVFAAILVFFLQQRCGSGPAFTASFMLLTSIEWFRSASTARVDMVFAALLAGALLMNYRVLCEGAGRIFVALTGLVLGLAVLAKGPVALVMYCAVVGVWLALQRRRRWSSAVLSAAGICMLAALVGSAWYVTAYLARPEEFLAKVYYENVARFLGTQDDEPHRASAFALYGQGILGFLPWSLIPLALFGQALARREIFTRIFWVRFWSEQRPLERYAWVVCAVVVLFFSIPSGKRGVYLLPAYPFAAMLVSFWVGRYMQQESAQRGARLYAKSMQVIVACLLVIVTVAPVMARVFENHSTNPGALLFYLAALPDFAASLTPIDLVLIIALPALTLVASFYVRSAVASTFALWFAFLLGLNAVVLPYFANLVSPRPFAARLGPLLPSDQPLYSWGAEFYGLSFYLNRRMQRLEENMSAARGMVVVYERDEALLKDRLGHSVHIREVARSSHSIVKPLQRVVVLEFSAAERAGEEPPLL